MIRIILAALFCILPAAGREPGATQYILINTRSPDRKTLDEIRTKIPCPADNRIRLGFSTIFSYFADADDHKTIESLQNTLRLAEETNMPFYIQLDGEVWWQGRRDLWNWWDANKPGFDPENRKNVEWSSWSPDDALKISWLNWGRQIRLAPPPNLMSPAYRAACHEEMRRIVPTILKWADALPVGKKDLFAGIKLGWESSIGMHQFYYPNGNDLIGKPESEDPATGIDAKAPPARGVAQIGYAAVSSAGIRHEGAITELDLATVAQRHLAGLSRVAAGLGVPREKLFTHAAGWKENELLYRAALNEWSCPGWSLYKNAADPTKDAGVQNALKISDAPFWAATEWLFQGSRDPQRWRTALETTLAAPKCKLICIFNWSDIEKNPGALEAIREVVAGSAK